MNHWHDLKLPRIKAGLQNTKLYNGRDYEPELGLYYYYRHRYYNPTQGRFINQDPLLYVDGPNPYSYVNNNPVNYVDPWGLYMDPILKQKIQEEFYGLVNGTKRYINQGKENISNIAQETKKQVVQVRNTSNNFVSDVTNIASDITEHIVDTSSNFIRDNKESIAIITCGGSTAITAITCAGGGASVAYTAGGTAPLATPACISALKISGATCAGSAGLYSITDNNFNYKFSGNSGGGKKKVASNKSRKQNKKLSDGEIKKLKKSGHNPEKLKRGDAGLDLYKDEKGDIYIQRKPKYLKGIDNYVPEPLFMNIKDL